MKLQRSTIILLLLALGLGGFVYAYETQRAAQLQQAEAKEQKIFAFEADQVESLKVKTTKQTLELELENESDKSKWLMKAPLKTSASDASVSYLLNLLVGKSDRTIQVPVAEIQDYGLDRPQATISVKLKNQKTHQLILGKPDFNSNSLYAQADPPAKPVEKLNVLLVSTDFENAVNRPLSEWKSEDTSKGTSDQTAGESTTKDSIKVSPSASPSPKDSKGDSKKTTGEPKPKASSQPSFSTAR